MYPIRFILACSLALCHLPLAAEDQPDPAEVTIGERLFLETRFAQAYAAQPGKADPVLQVTRTVDGELPGPFAGKTMNCRSCHLVDEQLAQNKGGMRSYADFARLSPIPDRKDGHGVTLRNAQSMVNISPEDVDHALRHHDGQFLDTPDLVKATLTGRNMGWLPGEYKAAVQHIAKVIRQDDGQDALGREFGGSYARLLQATDSELPPQLRLPEEHRLDVAQASDEEILNTVAKLIAAYVDDLNYEMDEEGNYTGSSYDRFLAANGLPRQPARGESHKNYSLRLLRAVDKLQQPAFITGEKQQYHDGEFKFGKTELAGMRIFFGRGNCIACHAAPHFSDFSFHNTGATQLYYDRTHGQGAFNKLQIPDLRTRNRDYDAWLPATPEHPAAKGPFRSDVNKDRSGQVDLGMWNVFANPDMPRPQPIMRQLLCLETGKNSCSDEDMLPMALARFKTPVLRDLGHSDPHLHAGQAATLEDVLSFYITVSSSARQGQWRNLDREILSMSLRADDMVPLLAFLRALNEDYN
jgi:cytochrome c peroxidase